MMMIWNGKMHLARPMTVRDKCWLGGKFAVKIGQQEVVDSGLHQTRETSGPWHPGAPLPRWTRWAKYQRRKKLQVLNGGGAVCLKTDYTGKVMLAVYPNGVKVPRFRYGRVMKWERDGRTGWDKRDAGSDLPSIVELPSDTVPRRIVWWIREGERLVRVRKAPPPDVRVAATVYHFCPTPGAFARVEIVEPYTESEWRAILERERPQTFLDQLDIMREQILTFKDTPETLQDPEASPEFASWRMNPVWRYFNSAGVALDKLKAAMAYDDEKEPREKTKHRIEFIARQALALGENFAKLGLTHLVPAVQRGRQMDRRGKQGPPKKVPLWEAVEAFSANHAGKTAKQVLRSLKIAVGNRSVALHISSEGFWYHTDHPGTEARESTVSKRITQALGALKKSPRKNFS